MCKIIQYVTVCVGGAWVWLHVRACVCVCDNMQKNSCTAKLHTTHLTHATHVHRISMLNTLGSTVTMKSAIRDT